MVDIYNAINPFYLSVGNIYLQYYSFIDALIVLTLFISISNWIFTKKYKGKEGKMIGVAVGLALTMAFVVFQLYSGFKFGDLHALAALIILILINVFVYELLVGAFGDEKKACAFALTYLLTYGLFLAVKSEAISILFQQYRFVWGILNLAFVIAFIKFIICIIGMFTDGGKHEEHGDSHGADHGAAHDAPHPPGAHGPEGGHGPAGHGPEDHGGSHDGAHAAHPPLYVQLLQPLPGTEFKPGQPIPVLGAIQGGTGNYVWKCSATFDTNLIQPFNRGSGSKIAATIVNLTKPGHHHLKVEVEDGEHHAHAHVEFHIHEDHAAHDTREVEGHIKEFADVVKEFILREEQFELAAKNLLNVTHAISIGQAHPSTEAHAYQLFVEASDKLAHATEHVVKDAQKIGKDTHISHLRPETAKTLAAIYAAYYERAVRLDKFWLDFQKRRAAQEAAP